MSAERKRNDTIAAFDEAVRLVGHYIETCPDREGRARLSGVLSDLRDVRHRFELATAPDEVPS